MSRHAYDPLKRVIDVVVSGIVVVLTLPLQIVIALLVRRKLGSPVIFRQERPGKDEAVFKLVKFRTMLPLDPDRGLISDEQRMTKLGAFLRSSSLDELPTLVNVLKGDMSLVGPRPLLPRYTPFMTSEERARFDVRPGVTGWAQVNGRNNAAWDDRLAMDVWYVKHRSLRLDARCAFLTIVRLVRRTDVNVVPGRSMLDLDEERAGGCS